MAINNSFIVKRVAINTIVNWITRVFIALSAVIVTPILISGLGKYEYGIWVLIGQIISFLLIADLGVANSVGRLIVKYDVTDRQDIKTSIYSSSLVIFFMLMFIVAIAALLLTIYLPELLAIKKQYSDVTQYVFLILAANIVIIFPLRVGRGLLQAKHRFDYIDIITTIAKLLQLVVILLLYYIDNITLLAIAWVIAAVNILSELVIFIKAKTLHKELQFKTTAINRNAMMEVFSLSGASVIQTLSAAVSKQGMVLVTSIILGVIYAPLLSIPLMLLLTLGPLSGRIGTTFMPIASEFDSLDQVQKIIKLSVYGTRYTFMIGLLITVYVLIYGKQLLILWLPEAEISTHDIETMYNSLLMLIVPFMLVRSNQGNRTILRSTGSHWQVSYILLFSSILGLIVGALLMMYTSLGIYGAVIALSFKLLLGDYLLILTFLLKKYKVKKLTYLTKAYVWPLLAIIPIIAINFLIANWLGSESWQQLLLNMILFSIVSVVSVYFLCVEKAHFKMLIALKEELHNT